MEAPDSAVVSLKLQEMGLLPIRVDAASRKTLLTATSPGPGRYGRSVARTCSSLPTNCTLWFVREFPSTGALRSRATGGEPGDGGSDPECAEGSQRG